MSAPNLSLYGIETQLLELIQFRESIAEDPDITPQEQQASLQAVDQQIREYVTAEVKKVDGIAHYLAEFERRAEIDKEEAKRLKARADKWQQRHDHLEELVINVMQMAGKTKLEGQHNEFALRKNPPSVEIRQPGLVPPQYKWIQPKISLDLWLEIMDDVEVELELRIKEALGGQWMPEASKTLIGEALKAGVDVPGACWKPESHNLRVS